MSERINTLEFAKLFSQALDRQMIDVATSSWMESNAGQVIYNGGDEVKVPILTTSGLGDYDRDTGAPQGAVTQRYQTRTLTQERGVKFQLDPMDIDEANFVPTVGNVVGEFQRLHVIPEIDAYRYSTLAQIAIGASQTSTYTPSTTDVYQKLKAELDAMRDVIGPAHSLVIVMSVPVLSTLEQSDRISRNLGMDTFTNGALNSRVSTVDGIPILPVSSRLMRTEYQYFDGRTAGQTQGGFAPTNDSKPINWLIMVRHAPIAISKTEVLRIFDPLTNQALNAWQIDYRKYHDLWVLDNQKEGLWANVGA